MRLNKALGTMVVAALVFASTAKANLVTYTESLNANANISNFLGVIGGLYSYTHSNPFESQGGYSPSQYLAAANAGNIASIDLTLDLSGMGGGEKLAVAINALGTGWTVLGQVTGNSPVTFNLLDPSYGFGPTGGLDGLPVLVRLTGIQGFALGGSATLQSSSLSVRGEPVPVPAAAWLAAFGVGMVAVARRRNAAA